MSRVDLHTRVSPATKQRLKEMKQSRGYDSMGSALDALLGGEDPNTSLADEVASRTADEVLGRLDEAGVDVDGALSSESTEKREKSEDSLNKSGTADENTPSETENSDDSGSQREQSAVADGGEKIVTKAGLRPITVSPDDHHTTKEKARRKGRVLDTALKVAEEDPSKYYSGTFTRDHFMQAARQCDFCSKTARSYLDELSAAGVIIKLPEAYHDEDCPKYETRSLKHFALRIHKQEDINAAAAGLNAGTELPQTDSKLWFLRELPDSIVPNELTHLEEHGDGPGGLLGEDAARYRDEHDLWPEGHDRADGPDGPSPDATAETVQGVPTPADD